MVFLESVDVDANYDPSAFLFEGFKPQQQANLENKSDEQQINEDLHVSDSDDDEEKGQDSSFEESGNWGGIKF